MDSFYFAVIRADLKKAPCFYTGSFFIFDKMCFSHYDKINENDYHIKGS